MGGLVGLDYLKRLGGRHRVRRLVMLGTPAQGTWSALLGLVTAPLGLASLQLLPGSPFLRELAERPLPPGAEVVSIGADARLAGAAVDARCSTASATSRCRPAIPACWSTRRSPTWSSTSCAHRETAPRSIREARRSRLRVLTRRATPIKLPSFEHL